MRDGLALKVKVEPGMFSHERFVTISTGNGDFYLYVDVSSLVGDLLRVFPVYQVDDEVLVDLPQETLTTGSRIRVPREMLVPLPAA
jgi:hypothetical protein